MTATLGKREYISPKASAAKAKLDEATKLHDAARNSRDLMRGQNERHAAALEKAERQLASSSGQLITNEHALRHGGGGNYVVHGARHEDPAQTPWSDAELKKAKALIRKRAKTWETAQETWRKRSHERIDVVQECVKAKTPFYATRRVLGYEPGEPVSLDALMDLAPAKWDALRRAQVIEEIPTSIFDKLTRAASDG